MTDTEELLKAKVAVFAKSVAMPTSTLHVRGHDFNTMPSTTHAAGDAPLVDYQALMRSFATTGFQASNVAAAANEIMRMLHWQPEEDGQKKGSTSEGGTGAAGTSPVAAANTSARQADAATEQHEAKTAPEVAAYGRGPCTIFLGFTSNMISCGVREQLRFLVQHKLVDCVVTTGGGIEEDFMKCFAPHYMGTFHPDGASMRKAGLNCIGNLVVPNVNYCKFEDWLMPILTQMLHEQQNDGVKWTPSKMIARLGKEIAHPDSVYYWAWKNDIPVYCPAITDGSVGDMIFFHSYQHPGLILDIVADVRTLNDTALDAEHTGMIILGGGLVKHHICNANLMRNGADFSVFVNTGHAFDGSDSGAPAAEAVTWGKIKASARPVKVHGDASIIFPLMVAETFAQVVSPEQRIEMRKEEERMRMEAAAVSTTPSEK